MAVTRGPIVYCLEEADNGSGLFKVHAGGVKNFESRYEKDLLEGVVTLSCTGKAEADWEDQSLYRDYAEAPLEDRVLRWIPYYSWANRAPGEMTVWVNK
jgi:DUF1680 family protein